MPAATFGGLQKDQVGRERRQKTLSFSLGCRHGGNEQDFKVHTDVQVLGFQALFHGRDLQLRTLRGRVATGTRLDGHQALLSILVEGHVQ